MGEPTSADGTPPPPPPPADDAADDQPGTNVEPAAEARAEVEQQREQARERERDERNGEAEVSREEERRKRRERRRGMLWDKDAHGNTVAPSPAILAAANGQLPALQAHAPYMPPGYMAPPAAGLGAATPLLQQQAGLTRRARRIHIGSLPPGCTQQVLRDTFNDALHRSSLTLQGATECINEVSLDPSCKFAFIEFRSPAEATSALALDGLVVLGKTIRVQRPNDYIVAPPELNEVIIPPGITPAVAVLPPPPLGAAMGGALVPPGVPPGVPPAMAVSGVTPPPPPPPPNIAATLNAQLLSGISSTATAQQTAMQISRKARRLHIGNLPQNVGLTPDMMKQFFNATLTATGLVDATKTGDPVIDCTINPAGKFAFVEFRTIAEATSALTLNNVELGGRQLRVERPRDYTPVPAQSIPELDKSGVVGETPICNVQKVTEEATLGAAGVPMPPPGVPQYGLPGVALPPPAPGLGALPPPPPPQPAARALSVDPSSRLLSLSSMVTDVELGDESECLDILDDAKTECAKHGGVEGILLLKAGVAANPPAGLDPGLVGAADKHILVLFDQPGSAARAAEALHGKKFDGRIVEASFLHDGVFAQLQGLPHHTK